MNDRRASILRTCDLFLLRAAVLVVTAAVSPGLSAHDLFSIGEHSRFNKPGNILIADQFNNRVIDVDPNGKIVWQFGVGPNDLTDRSVIGVNDAERVGKLTLISGTGLAPFLDSALPRGRLITGSCWWIPTAKSSGSTASFRSPARARTY